LEDALEMLGEGDSILRVRVWTSLVRSRRIIDSPEQIYNMTKQAVQMGRRVNDPSALYEALLLIVWGDQRPERSDERIAALEEMKDLAESMNDLQRTQDVLGYLAREYLERGDLAGWKKTYDPLERLFSTVQQPFYLWTLKLLIAMKLISEGQFEKAEQTVIDAFEFGQVFSIDNIEGAYGVQMFTIRREQGRLQELAPFIKRFVQDQPAKMTWQPGLALLYRELENRKEASELFYEQAKNNFEDIPADSMWLTSIAYLSEVCAYLGDQDHAQVLYELLKPYDGKTLFAGFSEVNYGAVSRFLGLLAMTAGCWDAAERHLQDALKLNYAVEAWIWHAHTQYLYAIFLLTRPQTNGRREDLEKVFALLDEVLGTTQDFGMAALKNKTQNLIEKERNI
jgi:tetratricopeptide (TPR) repeat protein